jgi:3-methylcrotonyl-CoA carboxylase alpha subunit
MFDAVLIANRGEIAVRVIATCRRLGIRTVAVYSEADAAAMHVRLADEAVCVGPAPAPESYLRIEAIIEAARRHRVQAIHPGYGFLSENERFAEACLQAGLVFVGPPLRAMRAMSSKATAKTLMQRSGVPLLPGYHGEDQSVARLALEAERIGYPILIKATAGGGGKGMRVVDRAADLEERLASCQREARQGFGDERVLLEKYLLRPRHIEVQVFGDMRGQVLHLHERDCSAQRRHQKVLEEGPALVLSDSQRQSLTRAACAAARAVGYVGAGTVEFLLDAGAGFYFMEMNTRIQVEHPVTEMITGIDLVEWQLRIADGEALPLQQEQIPCRGHAMEARLYAEVPEAGFLPSSGTLRRFELPAVSSTLRIDSGVAAGDTIGIDYDPMLAKLIVWGPTRPEAVVALRSALGQVRITGVGNNLRFLRRLAGSQALWENRLDVGFIEREPALLGVVAGEPPPAALAAAALWMLRQPNAPAEATVPPTAWSNADGWRLNAYLRRRLMFEADTLHAVEIAYGPDTLSVAVGARIEPATLREEGHELFLLQWGEQSMRLQIEAEMETDGTPTLLVGIGAASCRLRYRDPLRQEVDTHAANASLAAPMPGRVIMHLVTVGDRVERGAPLLIMEAMKMEHTLCAPSRGSVRAYLAAVGEQVKEGRELIDFEANP